MDEVIIEDIDYGGSLQPSERDTAAQQPSRVFGVVCRWKDRCIEASCCSAGSGEESALMRLPSHCLPKTY